MDTINRELDKEVTEMKKIFYTLGLTVVFNVAGVAQKTAKPANQPIDQSNVTSKSDSSAKASKTGGSSSFSAVSSLQAQLQNTLDAKNAKVGDQVILKTTQSIKQDGQVVIPKGSQLIGRVTEVRQRAKNGAASKLGLVFDQLKTGQSVTPITASIVSMINANSSSSLDQDLLNSDLSGSGSGSASARRPSGNSGGGLLGGVTNTVGGVVDSTAQTVGGVANTAGQTLGNTTSSLGQTVNGIQISAVASGSAQGSTMLSSQNKDIRLEKGVTFGLNIQKSGTN
jgi:hypothetical protein